MAVPHFSVSIVSRGGGRSAVLSAAYRHCARMDYEREGRVVDYSRKQGLLHEEFTLPPDAPLWARALIADRSVAGASEAFWNRVEGFEKRTDAQLAKDVTIALPLELSADQNVELVRDFVAEHILSKGMVADWVYHDAPGNPHVHLMMTLRPLIESGFGAKKVPALDEDGQPLRNEAGKIVYDLWAGGAAELNAFRDGWFACQNRHLALAGIDLHVDGRSYKEQGLDVEPTVHIGVGAKAIDRKAQKSSWSPKLDRLAEFEERRTDNRQRIERRPEIALDLVSREMSVFTERDIAKVLHRYVDDVATFQSLMARILHNPEVLRLEAERIEFATGIRAPAKYTTRELIRLEAEMAHRAVWLAGRSSHGFRKEILTATFDRHERLSDEQRAAIEHVAGEGRLATVVGRAGAGKTTMMKAAREAWEAAGYRVVGGALAGKAAEGLEKEAGIASRTLASWELAWQGGRERIDEKTIFVLDEAGMVSSRQMALFVEAAVKTGAKLVLVGDPDQLQPIEAGAAFRAIADRVGYAELETIYRQREQWMRDASLDLARGHVAEALKSYEANGRLLSRKFKAEAVDALIKDWNREYDRTKSTLILAHLRRDVRALNDMARAKLVERGIVEEGHAFRTADGLRRFATGDQIVFLKNEGSLGVKNGMIGHVIEARPGWFAATVGEGEHRRHIEVDQRIYTNVDLGYATTIHKSQGATVDRVKVLASLSLDRHLTYVALTRHREDVGLYYGQISFRKAGGLTKILSQRRAKETTLDYEHGPSYRAALRFAEARGLHLVRVARALVADKLRWTVRQKEALAHLGQRLLAISARLSVGEGAQQITPEKRKEAKPMVAGIATFAKSIDQSVEDKLAADPGLKKQWEEVSTRFRLVFADPKSAFRMADVDNIVKNGETARSTLSKLKDKPESFGVLKGKSGLLASRADRQDRARAELNAPALARELDRYLRLRAEAERKHEAEERSARMKVATDVPALSPAARQVLERVRDAIDRNDLPAALAFALEDKMVKAELEGFTRAVSERFGERSMLSNAAKEPDGAVFEKLAIGMSPAQRAELMAAWPAIRTAQRLAAQERATSALKQAATVRQSQTQGLKLQ